MFLLEKMKIPRATSDISEDILVDVESRAYSI